MLASSASTIPITKSGIVPSKLSTTIGIASAIPFNNTVAEEIIVPIPDSNLVPIS